MGTKKVSKKAKKANAKKTKQPMINKGSKK